MLSTKSLKKKTEVRKLYYKRVNSLASKKEITVPVHGIESNSLLINIYTRIRNVSRKIKFK